MSGNLEGGRKTAAKIKEKYGPNFYKEIGSVGGSKVHPQSRPFYTNRELARTAGYKGGTISRKGKKYE